MFLWMLSLCLLSAAVSTGEIMQREVSDARMSAVEGQIVAVVGSIDALRSETTGNLNSVRSDITALQNEEVLGCIGETLGGGGGGSAFNDLSVSGNGRITKIHIRLGEFNECIGFTYGSTRGTCHGSNGSGNPRYNVQLASDENIIEVSGIVAGGLVKQLKFKTNKTTHGPYGQSSGVQTFKIGGKRLAFISGNVGRLLDNLRFHFYC